MRQRLIQILQAIIDRLTANNSPAPTSPRSTAHAEALVRTAAHLNQHIEQQALLEAICQEATRVLDIPVAAIALFDRTRSQFKVAASEGLHATFAEEAPPLPLRWFRQSVGHALQPSVVPDLQEFEQTPLGQRLLQYQFRSIVFVELHYRERLLGILLVSTLRTVREFTKEDLDLLSGLADQAAQAILNAQLFRALRLLLQRTQRQSHHMQRIIDAVPEGLILLGNDNRILLASPAAQHVLAYLAPGVQDEMPLQALGGRPIDDLITESGDGANWLELESQPAGDDERDREPRVFELAARPITERSDDARAILVIRDVTEERQRRKVAQSQDRLATVGQLAAGIAHDFNNIMAVITLYSQTLERNPDFPKRREYLATISEQARHASDLIVQILDFSRRTVMERGRLDLLPFVKEMVKLLQRTLPENISVTLQAESGEYEVSADPTRLQQALMNLALNARDAMPQGGELQISLAAIDLHPGEAPPVAGMDARRYMCLSIADTGEGIVPEHLPRLFEPFYTTKAPGLGTGMGLAQVYGIVKQHGGEIEVDSNPGQGARFTIYLPGRDPTPSEPAHRFQKPVAHGNITVLLVEDHEPTREAISDTLDLLGYNVLTAETGREALALFERQAHGIDIVLSDLVMPEMGGVALYQELSTRDPQLKMIVMTGYPLEEEGRALLEQGILQWLRKPFSPDALATKITEVLAAD